MSGIVVVDVDGSTGKQSLLELEKRFGTLPQSVMQITPGKIIDGQRTGKGHHWIFMTGQRKFRCRINIAEKIDIKADGGYIVAAPSVHPAGTGSYAFAKGLSFEDIKLAELPAAWIEFLLPKEPAKGQATADCPELPPASEAIIEACRQEIVLWEPAVEGQGGDKQTYKVARTIFYDWGLDEHEGEPILNEFNMRCVPAWDNKQLQHKIDCALTSPGKRQRGWKRTARPIKGEYHPAFGAFVLNPSRTRPSALAFRREHYHHAEDVILRYYAGDFYCWSKNHYKQIPTEVIKGDVLDWLTKAVKLDRHGKQVPFPANNKNVNDVVEALKSVCLLPEEIEPGTWLDDGEKRPASSFIFAQNGVYDWKADKGYCCSPLWFNLSCLNTVIRDKALTPKRWLQFLDELWGNDQASKDLLHEFMGLTLTLDTSFQKMLLIIGPKRSGKGTIFRTLEAIHGKENVAGPTADSLTQNFGLAPLLGKPLAIIRDARFAETGKFSLPVLRKLLCDNHLRLPGQAGQANVNKIVTT